MANVAQAKLCVKGYGKNFKALRENARLTQEQLGKILMYSSKTISNIESEQRLPSNEQLLSYKNHFNVSLDYLTGHTTVTDVELSKMSEYTGLSEKALEQLHEFSSSVHDAYVLGSVLETSNLLFFDTIINQLFEKNIFQDIVLYACELMFESTLLVEGGEQILNDDNTGLNFRFYQSDLECDVQRLKISEILSRITDFCDERAKQKEKYNSLMKRFNSEKKHDLEGVFLKFNLDKEQQSIFDKYFRASDGNEEGDENG
jgi:transcriptional regulator with XRE-family HTH domain